MKRYGIVTRVKVGEGVRKVDESPSYGVAEGKAQDIYREELLDMVMVVELVPDYTRASGHRMECLMKIERTCKHPNVQGDFLLGQVCLECGLVFHHPSKYSNIEIGEGALV